MGFGTKNVNPAIVVKKNGGNPIDGRIFFAPMDGSSQELINDVAPSAINGTITYEKGQFGNGIYTGAIGSGGYLTYDIKPSRDAGCIFFRFRPKIDMKVGGPISTSMLLMLHDETYTNKIRVYASITDSADSCRLTGSIVGASTQTVYITNMNFETGKDYCVAYCWSFDLKRQYLYVDGNLLNVNSLTTACYPSTLTKLTIGGNPQIAQEARAVISDVIIFDGIPNGETLLRLQNNKAELISADLYPDKSKVSGYSRAGTDIVAITKTKQYGVPYGRLWGVRKNAVNEIVYSDDLGTTLISYHTFLSGTVREIFFTPTAMLVNLGDKLYRAVIGSTEFTEVLQFDDPSFYMRDGWGITATKDFSYIWICEYEAGDNALLGNVWRSNDDGQTWTKILHLKDLYPLAKHVHCLKYDQYTGQLWLGFGDDPAANGVLVSNDLGATFTEVKIGIMPIYIIPLQDSVLFGNDSISNLMFLDRYDRKLDETYGVSALPGDYDSAAYAMMLDSENRLWMYARKYTDVNNGSFWISNNYGQDLVLLEDLGTTEAVFYGRFVEIGDYVFWGEYKITKPSLTNS